MMHVLFRQLHINWWLVKVVKLAIYMFWISSPNNTLSSTGIYSICSTFHGYSVTWHKTLDHLSYSKNDFLSDVLHLSKSKTNKTISDIRHICHLSKHKHLSFKSRNNMCIIIWIASNWQVGPFWCSYYCWI